MPIVGLANAEIVSEASLLQGDLSSRVTEFPATVNEHCTPFQLEIIHFWGALKLILFLLCGSISA